MSAWRQLAEGVLKSDALGDNRDNRAKTPGAFVAEGVFDPRASFKEWRAELDRLDWRQPLHGLGELRWRRLLEDSQWLLDRFGEQAARDGWSGRDLFGVLPGHDAWGGVADRLRAARGLVMTAERACWRDLITGGPIGYVRGQGDKPPLMLMWERSA